jgi:hypothetical protein
LDAVARDHFRLSGGLILDRHQLAYARHYEYVGMIEIIIVRDATVGLPHDGRHRQRPAKAEDAITTTRVVVQ